MWSLIKLQNGREAVFPSWEESPVLHCKHTRKSLLDMEKAQCRFYVNGRGHVTLCAEQWLLKRLKATVHVMHALDAYGNRHNYAYKHTHYVYIYNVPRVTGAPENEIVVYRCAVVSSGV